MKYYRVKKDTFLWKAGAIIKLNPELSTSKGGYLPIEDIWNVVSAVGNEYITAPVIEDPANSDWFERVYPDNLKGSLYRTKDQLIELYKGAFKE